MQCLAEGMQNFTQECRILKAIHLETPISYLYRIAFLLHHAIFRGTNRIHFKFYTQEDDFTQASLAANIYHENTKTQEHKSRYPDGWRIGQL